MGKIKVTAKLYRTIKALSEDPKRDEVIAKRFGLCKSTVRSIRNTKNYQDYLNRLQKYKLNRKEKELKKAVRNIKNKEQVLYRRSPAEIKREDEAGMRLVAIVGAIFFMVFAAIVAFFVSWLISGVWR